LTGSRGEMDGLDWAVNFINTREMRGREEKRRENEQ
jgi:hypothetical protein